MENNNLNIKPLLMTLSGAKIQCQLDSLRKLLIYAFICVIYLFKVLEYFLIRFLPPVKHL